MNSLTSIRVKDSDKIQEDILLGPLLNKTMEDFLDECIQNVKRRKKSKDNKEESKDNDEESKSNHSSNKKVRKATLKQKYILWQIKFLLIIAPNLKH